MIDLLVLAVAGFLAATEPPGTALIQGVVVNGSRGAAPVAGAEVVLRAGRGNQFKHLAGTTTDSNGRFSFGSQHLASSAGLVYIPGANWEGIHYPGPRLQIDPAAPAPNVQLTVYDAVSSPSPLIAEVHEIDINVAANVLEVTEIVVVNNPSSASYIGTPNPDAPEMPPATLSMRIPDGVAHVTFNKEFDGRNFRLLDGRLVTDVPWPPGKRQLAFKYELPVEKNQLAFERHLDLPCLHARVSVAGECPREPTCNLPKVTAANAVPIAFESAGETLPAGYKLQLEMHQLSVPWIVYARWGAIVLLAVLLAATAVYSTLRKTRHAGRTASAMVNARTAPRKRPVSGAVIASHGRQA
jgi:hypothetical protein